MDLKEILKELDLKYNPLLLKLEEQINPLQETYSNLINEKLDKERQIREYFKALDEQQKLTDILSVKIEEII